MLVILGTAAFLRFSQAVLRWDEVSWLYSAYPGAVTDALQSGSWGVALTTFPGLHPPLWPLLHSVSETLLPAPMLWLLGSALASWGAVLLVSRQSLWAGALLAVAPVQLHYAAEVNDYPLATFFVALAWTGHQRAMTRERWGLMAAAGVLAAWTHVLAGAAVGAAALTLPRALSARVVGLICLSWLPLLPGGIELMEQGGATQQPDFKLGLVVSDYFTRFGPWALLALPPFLIGARKRPDLAAAWLATAGLLGLLITAGMAAPHQFPTQLFLGIPAVLMLSRALEPTWSRRWVTGLIGAQLVWALTGTGSRLLALGADGPRAIDVALEELESPWTCEPGEIPSPDCTGDALVLLAPAGLNDDDKNRISTVLWRLPPWKVMPRVEPYEFHHADFVHGQPRLVDGFVVYVHDHPRATLERLEEAHHRIFVVVYEQGQRVDYRDGLADRLGVFPEPIGKDLLFRLP